MDGKQAASTHVSSIIPDNFLHQVSIAYTCEFLMGMISTNAIISALGTALGRGTLISIVIVMMVLPQIVLLCDKFIEEPHSVKGNRWRQSGEERNVGIVRQRSCQRSRFRLYGRCILRLGKG